MRATIKLKTTEQGLRTSILKQLITPINKVFRSIVNSGVIKRFLDAKVEQAILNSPEYYSLVYGELRSLFNLQTPENDIQQIIDTIKTSLFVEFIPFKVVVSNFIGNLSIRFIRSDFSDVLSLPLFTQIQDQNIKWLEVLLLQSDVFFSFDINFTEERIDLVVPSEYVGSLYNNWLTRALFDIESEFKQFIETELRRRF